MALRLAAAYESHEGYTQQWNDYAAVAHDPIIEQLYFQPEGKNTADNSLPMHATNNTHSKTQQDDLSRNAYRISALFQPVQHFVITARYEQHHNSSKPAVFLDPYLINNFERAIVVDSPAQHDSTLEILGLDIHYKGPGFSIAYKFGTSDYNNSNTIDYDAGRQSYFNELRAHHFQSRKNSHNLEFYTDNNQHKLHGLFGIRKENTQQENYNSQDIYSLLSNNENYPSGTLFITPNKKSDLFDIYGYLSYPLTSNLSFFSEVRRSNAIFAESQGRYISCTQNIITPITNSLTNQAPQYFSHLHDNSKTDDYFNQQAVPCSVYTFDGSKHRSNPTAYRIGSEYRFNPQLISELSYTKGVRPELNNRISQYSQTSQTIEVSLSGIYLKEKLTFSLTGFNAQHKNMLVGWSDDNEINAVTQGLELTAKVKPWHRGTLSIGGSRLKARIKNHEKIDHIFPDNTDWNHPSKNEQRALEGYKDLSGNQLPLAPDWNFLLRYTHNLT